VRALPPEVAITGVESSELKALVADASAPAPRGARTAVFAAEWPPPPADYALPRGLRRTELAARGDASTDRAVTYLATDGKGHGALLGALKRSGARHDEVERVLTAWKVPVTLVAIAFVESGFEVNATSLDGGAGLWSLPKDVARAYGLATLETYDERRAVALSTEAAGHYLADLHERLGSWELAILAFGMGYASTVDAIHKQNAADYWDLVTELPKASSQYVAEVLAVATMLDNRDRFGLDTVKLDDPIVTSDLEVPAGASFATVARAAGTSVETLRALNPEYLGNTVPDTGFAMAMHLPSAGLARAKELLMPLMYSTSSDGVTRSDPRFDYGRGHAEDGGAARDAGAATGPVLVAHGGDNRMFYRVQDGDTLDSLARRFSVSRDTIAKDNALDPSAGLRAGQLLLLRPGAPAPR
jgi:membrane-bound lytic murein transglycosylase D